MVPDSLSLVGLGEHPSSGGEFLIETSTIVSSTLSVRLMRSRWRGLRAMSSPPVVDGGLDQRPLLGGKGRKDGDVLLGCQRDHAVALVAW